MGLLSLWQRKKYKRLDIRNLLQNIPGLTPNERKLVETEFLKKYQPDYRLDQKEVAQVLKFLFKHREISDNDVKSILKRFDVPYRYYSNTISERSSKLGGSQKERFYKRDVEKALYGIASLDKDERKLVHEELMREYRDDDKLLRREVIQVIRDLYSRRKISDNDMKALFEKFGIGKREIEKYR